MGKTIAQQRLSIKNVKNTATNEERGLFFKEESPNLFLGDYAFLRICSFAKNDDILKNLNGQKRGMDAALSKSNDAMDFLKRDTPL